MPGSKNSSTSDTDNTFIRRIANHFKKPVEKPGDTSEILVVELDSELELDEKDRLMLETLRAAHENCMKNTPDAESDAYNSVRIKV